ncbi:porin family protein [Thalassobellus citreus]|uniref:porin family protein n=1 Tax=Thalassobellus citreus TaxID=3367752 RepID=UPI00379FAE3F
MKRLSILTILLVISFSGFSQDVKYGVRGGLNISNLDFDGDSPKLNKHRNSIYFGAFATIGLSKTISVMPELQFSAEGAKDETLNLDYIQIPILLRFRMSEKIHFGLGPQVGLKVRKVDDNAKDFAYSAVAGLEYKLNHVLFADVRYTYGLANVFTSSLLEAKNTNIQIGVGYKF